ncbi:hypothetical protein B0H12DRAFT_1140018 [Mycena haematopus]|nr:hypothetical protein B0H12DRAFT_1140018 [Mycena haematopus]
MAFIVLDSLPTLCIAFRFNQSTGSMQARAPRRADPRKFYRKRKPRIVHRCPSAPEIDHPLSFKCTPHSRALDPTYQSRPPRGLSQYCP